MIFQNTDISGLKIMEPKVFRDSRGYFLESYRQNIIEEHIGNISFVQENESYSTMGVIRGLHYQLPPFAQSKLVHVAHGRIYDVAVDLRKNSKTFGRHCSIELSSDNKKIFFIPRGFAHGFIALSEFAIVCYKVDNYYSSQHERGIIYNDLTLNIQWPLDSSRLILSEKDMSMPRFSDCEIIDNWHEPYEENINYRG